MRVLNKYDRSIFTVTMVNYVKDMLVRKRPKNEYKDFAPSIVMIAYVYALGLHKSTRETWSKILFSTPYTCKHFVPIVNIDKDMNSMDASMIFNDDSFTNCVLGVLKLPVMTDFVTKNICYSKKLEYYKVNHTQQTCLIHLNACWHYMTSNYRTF
jgi:hypothetical protein